MKYTKAIALGFAVFAAMGAFPAALGAQEGMPSGPSPELKKLEYCLGTWSGEITMSYGGQETKGQVTIKNEWVNRGNFLRSVSTSDMGEMGKIESVSYTSYDAKAKTYRCFSFGDLSPQAREETGVLEGVKFVTTSKPWDVMGTSTSYRSTTELKGDGLYLLIEMKEGDSWTKLGEATLKKNPDTEPVEKTGTK